MAATEPRIYAEAVCYWIKHNDKSWKKLRRIVRNQIKQGHRVTRDNVYAIAMLNGMSISELEEFRRDHNMWAPLSRYMLMLEPRLWAGLRCKAAPIDTADLEGIWRENVNAGTTFLANSWQEARELYNMRDASAA